MGRSATQQEKDGMVAAYLSGMTACEAGALFGRSGKPVLTALKERGLGSRPAVRRTGLDVDFQIRVIELYRSGLGIREVASLTGKSQTRVQNILVAHGVERRSDTGGRKKEITEELREQARSLYVSGLSSIEVASKIGVSDSAVLSFLREHGIETRSRGKLTEEQRGDVVKRAAQGEPPSTLGKEFGVSSGTVINWMKADGVARAPAGFERKHFFDFDFFQEINTQEKAYWLGFIAADGCVHKENTLSIGLSAIDAAHLKKFADCIGLATWEPRVKKGSFNSEYVSLVLTSRQIVGGLKKWGIVERKSKCLQWPNFLSGEMLRHYLRGYFDGDGTWSQSKKVAWPFFGLCGFPEFVLGAQDFIVQECGIRRARPYYVHSDFCTIRNGAQKDVTNIAKFLYRGATVYLDRKYEKSKALLLNNDV